MCKHPHLPYAWIHVCMYMHGEHPHLPYAWMHVCMYLFTVASFSSKDAPVGAVQSAQAWPHARDQRAGRAPTVVSSRPRGLVGRGQGLGRRELTTCGDAVVLLEGQLWRMLRECYRSGTSARLRRCVVLDLDGDPTTRWLICTTALPHGSACQSARAWNVWLRAWLCRC